MANLRKLWKVTQGVNDGVRTDPATVQRPESQAKVYQIYVPNNVNAGTHDFTDVWVDERDGRGWRPYDQVQHAEWANRPEGED